MNIINLFDFSDKSLTVNNTFICIYEYNFWISIISINTDNYKYNYYSDEWLYLINYNYPNVEYYYFFINQYNNIVSNIDKYKDIIYFDKDVISLLTTFIKGSVHGYSGFYYTLITYLNNLTKYENKDIIIYNDTESGILSIINHLCNIGVITTNIIKLEKNKNYKFKSVTYIPNRFHVFKPELEVMIDNFINKYNIVDVKTNNTNEKCCIIKSSISNTNITNNGVFDNNVVENFCNKYNIYRIFPFNEIELINLIYNCKLLILSYGSTFFKNYIYISDLCEKIIVVINGDCYINDYKRLSTTTNEYQGNIYNKYKNATIVYIHVNNDLNFNPIII
jgi:hypothetical protein